MYTITIITAVPNADPATDTGGTGMDVTEAPNIGASGVTSENITDIVVGTIILVQVNLMMVPNRRTVSNQTRMTPSSHCLRSKMGPMINRCKIRKSPVRLNLPMTRTKNPPKRNRTKRST